MRIATGNIGHESSTFTPIETPYEVFQESSRGFHRGPELIEAMRDTNTGCGGFIDGAATHGYELVPLLWTFAEPSGPVHAEAWARLKAEFLERLEAAMPVDGALLDLHGAMVIQGIDDGEGDLLRGVRAILGPDRPVIVTLDLHANISDTMAELSDVIIPCDTYPHVDFRERGREAADLMVRTLRGEIRPTMAVELSAPALGRRQRHRLRAFRRHRRPRPPTRSPARHPHRLRQPGVRLGGHPRSRHLRRCSNGRRSPQGQARGQGLRGLDLRATPAIPGRLGHV